LLRGVTIISRKGYAASKPGESEKLKADGHGTKAVVLKPLKGT